MGLLDGKVALVTGAGHGLGRAHARLLAQEGAAVVVNDLGGGGDGTGRGTEAADSVVEEITGGGGRAVADYGTVTSSGDSRAMVRTAVDSFGRLDICILNAGILRDKTYKNMTDELWDSVLDVHLRGTYLVSKAAYDQMLAQRDGGRIVMTSSTSGLIGEFGQTNYGAAKAGIAGLMRCLALEGAKYGITVNLLAPTASTRLSQGVLPAELAEHMRPEKVSPAVVWLCTDEARDVTGRTFCVVGNVVALLDWQAVPVAARPYDEEPWSVAEIGRRVRESAPAWPRRLTLEDLVPLPENEEGGG